MKNKKYNKKRVVIYFSLLGPQTHLLVYLYYDGWTNELRSPN